MSRFFLRFLQYVCRTDKLRFELFATSAYSKKPVAYLKISIFHYFTGFEVLTSIFQTKSVMVYCVTFLLSEFEFVSMQGHKVY